KRKRGLQEKKKKEANIALIAEWEDVQAMMDADHELAERLQAKKQGELSIKERSKLFVELMNQRKKHFARLGAEEKRRKPPTKAQKRNQMCTYLKNMAGFTREELESDKSKKQKLDEKVEAEVDNDQDEAEIKMYMKIVPDDENIDREDLETLWKLVKAKYENTSPEESYERVLWGDLKVMFEPDIEKKMYPLTPATITHMLNRREDLETLWKLVKAKYENTSPEESYERVLWGDLKVMFEPDIEKKMYPLTPATITHMLNRRLQADH
nr:hypothetical protein [Tanacetum cinerariifolium]